VTLREAWRSESANWIQFARTSGHDRYYHLFNLPRFLDLVPVPGQLTVDVGCGEGRLGRELRQRGHRVLGFDSSEPAIRALGDNGSDTGVVADAANLPLRTGVADLATAFMSLQDMDDPKAAIGEIARVLAPRGRFCFALLHPFISAGDFRPDKESFVVELPYWEERRHEYHSSREGIDLTFWQVHRPLSDYTDALEEAGLLIEALREPRPDASVEPEVESARLMPVFLHGRAIKP
jgi:SAM-dependent methyltransferase